MNTEIPVAAYLRVSTEDQSTAPQERELMDYCQRRGWAPVVFRDVLSGTRYTRPGLNRMFAEVRRGSFKAVAAIRPAPPQPPPAAKVDLNPIRTEIQALRQAVEARPDLSPKVDGLKVR